MDEPKFTLKKAGVKKKTKALSIFDQLEAANAAFLSTAAQESTAFELARKKTAAAAVASLSSTFRQYFRPPEASTPTAVGKVVVDTRERAQREGRRRRFLADLAAAESSKTNVTLAKARASFGDTVHGQSTSLEKEYLRLTSLPDVADVRPPAVLAEALRLVQRRWAEGCSYRWACNQLKSIRQDLTVQHIKDKLTAAVYETHSRIALEVGDWAELKQALSVLRQLYAEAEGHRSSAASEKAREAAAEFVAYAVMLAAASGRGVLAIELQETAAVGLLDPHNHDTIKVALAAARAARAGDCVGLLRLYHSAPRMVPYLLDLLLERTRPATWSAVLAAYGGPSGVPLSKVVEWLGFEDEQECLEWIAARGGVVTRSDGRWIDVKASREGAKRLAAATASEGG